MSKKMTLLCLMVLCLWNIGFIYAQSTNLETDDTLEDSLSDDELSQSYSFSATEGDLISATLSSRQFDALLQIIDEDDRILIENDDSDGSLNSSIQDFTIPTDGEYQLIVTSSDGSGQGDYVLTFHQGQMQTLSYGDSVTGMLDRDTAEVVYQFEGQEDDMVSIWMVSGEVDSYITLANADFGMISDDDSGGSKNALLAAYVLPRTDTYFIRASALEPEVDGEFTLSLDIVEPVSVAVNEPIIGDASDGPVYYAFDVEAGDKISIRAMSDGGLVDTFLNIITPDGYPFGFDDDGGFVNDPEINDVIINESGQYIALVSPLSPDVEGEYEFSVVSHPIDTLACDSSLVIAFNSKITQIPYFMDLSANQMVTFKFTSHERAIDALFAHFSLEGEYITNQYSSDVDGEISLTITAPFSGQLQVFFSNYASQRHIYDVEIQCS